MAYAAFSSSPSPSFPILAATDPVGGADHSLPIRPEQGSTKPLESWEDQLRKRPRRKPSTRREEDGKPKDGEHQIDDYA